jgi:hypothetical protein
MFAFWSQFMPFYHNNRFSTSNAIYNFESDTPETFSIFNTPKLDISRAGMHTQSLTCLLTTTQK